jgi:hypothetical protein
MVMRLTAAPDDLGWRVGGGEQCVEGYMRVRRPAILYVAGKIHSLKVTNSIA